VATLATILVSFTSADIKAQQDKLQNSQTASSVRFGVCGTPGVAPQDNLPPGVSDLLSKLPAAAQPAAKSQVITMLKTACDQSMSGFEADYKITFYASILALIMSLFLPGWPGKWSGRGAAPVPAGGH
jgi:hypothetical protein